MKEKKYLVKHPFEIWKSEKVTEILVDFYEANFLKAGLEKGRGEEFVIKAWESKDNTDPEVLRKECDQILLRAKAETKNLPTEREPLDIISLDKIDKFLDIGANKLATINYYAQKYPSVEEFIGIDVIPQRNEFVFPKKCHYFQVDPEANLYPVEHQSIDLINIQFVFHHLPDLMSIKKNLEICQRIIRPRGKLVLWEESFPEKFDFGEMKNNVENLGIETDRELTERFYALSETERWEFIIANDWLINVNNPHMPWTGQYYSWPEWISLLKEFGFVLEKQYNLGLRINGRLKQGVHMVGIFNRGRSSIKI
jgi:ubiquinone/menaquinone biosynthesis C-methylase UbiE